MNLTPHGGRVFVQSASAESIDSCTIELKCTWSPGLLALFDESIRIGADTHKPYKWNEYFEDVPDEDGEDEIGWSLSDCPIMLTLHPVTEKWIEDSAAKNAGKPILGRFTYYEPDKPAVDPVYSKKPLVTAWVGLGPENFRLLRDRLVNTEAPDFELSITVRFPQDSVKSSWTGKDVSWDGSEPLPVTSATIAWMRSDWKNDSRHERRVLRDAEPIVAEPSSEHLQLMEKVGTLEAAVRMLATPLWIAVGAALIAIYIAA